MAISILSLLGFKWIGQAMNGIHGHPIPSPRLHPSEESLWTFHNITSDPAVFQNTNFHDSSVFLEKILVAMILRCSHGHVTEERHTFGRGTGHEPRNYGIGRVDRHPNVTRSGT